MTELPARWPEKVWAHHNVNNGKVSVCALRTRLVITSVACAAVVPGDFHVSQKRRLAVIVGGRSEVHAYVPAHALTWEGEQSA